MADTQDPSSPLSVVQRLRDAINAHDLDALVGCFAPDFRSDLPTFPTPRSPVMKMSAGIGAGSSAPSPAPGLIPMPA